MVHILPPRMRKTLSFPWHLGQTANPDRCENFRKFYSRYKAGFLLHKNQTLIRQNVLKYEVIRNPNKLTKT